MNNSFEVPTWTLSSTGSSVSGTGCIETFKATPFSIFVSLSTVSCLLAVIGNISIIWTINKNTFLQNISNNFVVSLCLSDLITGLLCNPLSIAMATLLRYEQEHERLESFLFFFVGVVLIKTTLTLTMISVDRYIAIVFPLRYQEIITPRKSACIVAAIWVFAVLVAFPRLILLQEDEEKIILASFVISLSVPLVITVCCYLKILIEARKKVSPITFQPKVAYCILKNKKAAVTMAMILGLFIIVYTPLFVFAILALCRIHVCDSHIADDWMWPVFVVCASAALNPLVYGTRNMMIRNALKKGFLSRGKKRRKEKNKSNKHKTEERRRKLR